MNLHKSVLCLCLCLSWHNAGHMCEKKRQNAKTQKKVETTLNRTTYHLP